MRTEALTSAQSRYYEKNKEKIKAKQKAYREANPDRFMKYRKKHAEQTDWNFFARKRAEERPWAARHTEIKQRAKKRGIEFSITSEYLRSIWPSDNRCPVLGIEFNRGKCSVNRDCAASIDRIDPSKGYIEGNVQVISQRANRIKNNATVEELKLLVEYMSR